MSFSHPAPALSRPALVDRAARWFLLSGIQEESGGVARYHFIKERRNAPVSTEITGYAVSAFLELHARTGDSHYLAAAQRAGDFLCQAWDASAKAMPFEWSADSKPPVRHSYFFDNGIIIRGLLRLWRTTGENGYLRTAIDCGVSMREDFVNSSDIHPILVLPGRTPIQRDGRWSRSSDCYQLKSALGWLELAEATGESAFEEEYEKALARALETHSGFLARETERSRDMDRLHAYCYFLEALLARIGRAEVRAAVEEGIARTAAELRVLRDEFERSDVCAQLLRMRLYAAASGAVPLEETAAAEEAGWTAAHQMSSPEPRLDGCFNFGRRAGEATNFANPVSTAFCLQALALWDDFQCGRKLAGWPSLI